MRGCHRSRIAQRSSARGHRFVCRCTRNRRSRLHPGIGPATHFADQNVCVSGASALDIVYQVTQPCPHRCGICSHGGDIHVCKVYGVRIEEDRLPVREVREVEMEEL